MAKSNDENIEKAIADGLAGSELGAVLTDTNENSMISALVGAAVEASIKAQNEAKLLDTPVFYEVDGFILKVFPDGRTEIVKKLKQKKSKIPSSFSLE